VSPAATVAIASCREAIERYHDEDEPHLLAALRSRGLEVGVWAWDDPAAPWEQQDLVLVRSTWDYPTRRDELLAWAERVQAATRLANDAETLRWTTDKRYLAELEAVGVPVVATRFLAPGDVLDLGPADVELVVKPTVSAGSQDTARYRPAQRGDADRHAADLLAAGREVMVQPYLEAVDHHGETAVVHLGGRYSHGMRKGALLSPGGGPVDGLYAAEQMAVREPSPAERALAEQVLGALPLATPPLYARIDLLAAADGSPVVLEVELAEPSLFLSHVPEAADRLADAVLARLAA
jgi:O-ureido-D-serine cyclo-ligase